MAMPSPGTTNEPGAGVVGVTVAAPDGTLLNLSMCWWVRLINKSVEVRYNQDNVWSSPAYASQADAEALLYKFRQAINPIVLGAPYITSITPSTAAAGSTIYSVIKGQGFKSGGTVKIGADACTVTFIDAFTLLVTVLGTAPASTVSVVYTDPDTVTTATLTNGYVWT